MKSLHTNLFLVLICLMHTLGVSQEKKKKAVDVNFDSYAHMVAIESFESLLAKGYEEMVIYKKLGNSNYLSSNYDVAAFWFDKLLTLAETKVEPDYFYRYALSLKSIKKYEESNIWMEKFRKAKAKDSRAILFSKNKEYLANISIPSEQYTVENFVKINSPESDFAPSYFLKGMVFATTRDLESEVDYNDFVYSNLYQVEIFDNGKSGALKKFSQEINTKANESSTAFSKDGKTVYFTRNNFKKNSFKRDENGVSRLKIYRATFQEGTWKNIKELPFNNKNYSVAHPTLNSSETKLYFVSDMPGGKGASDIYVVDILADGDFGIPQNLGIAINTEGKETFPFVSDSGTLYFASDGHLGLGGLDLFKIDLQKDKKVINLGKTGQGAAFTQFQFQIGTESELGNARNSALKIGLWREF